MNLTQLYIFIDHLMNENKKIIKVLEGTNEKYYFTVIQFKCNRY